MNKLIYLVKKIYKIFIVEKQLHLRTWQQETSYTIITKVIKSVYA